MLTLVEMPPQFSKLSFVKCAPHKIAPVNTEKLACTKCIHCLRMLSRFSVVGIKCTLKPDKWVLLHDCATQDSTIFIARLNHFCQNTSPIKRTELKMSPDDNRLTSAVFTPSDVTRPKAAHWTVSGGSGHSLFSGVMMSTVIYNYYVGCFLFRLKWC